MVRTDNWRFGEREMKRIETEKKKTLVFCGENTENNICLENKMKMKPSKPVSFMHHRLIN